MSQVAPFYTTKPEPQRVYHDNDQCKFGRHINPEDRIPGTDNRRRCEECAFIAKTGY
jgi:hypothetical protein